MKDFGTYLRRMREGNMTQRQLAKKIGVGYPYISKLENNIEPPPSEELLKRLAETFEVDLDEMFVQANKIPTDLQLVILQQPKLLKVLRYIKEDEMTMFLIEHFEELVKDKENLFRYFFKKTDSKMLLIDPETSEIVDANPIAARFYNYSLKKLKNMRITDINTLTKEEVYEEMEKAKLELRNFFNFKHLTNHEKIVDVHVKSVPIIIEGKTYLHSVIYDHKNKP